MVLELFLPFGLAGQTIQQTILSKTAQKAPCLPRTTSMVYKIDRREKKAVKSNTGREVG